MTAMPGDSWIGRVIDGRYRIVRPLGGGGMGSVFEAEHLTLHKRVALKVIHPDLVADDEIRQRFEREARATASVEHPHVITAMDFGTLPDGGAFLVMQLVRGISLRGRMKAGALEWREACEIAAQIADALGAIHARGFVHRDLTPENVLISKRDDGSPFVHVLDLGVVGLVEDAPRRKLTAEGHVVGTTGYMAPEQALGESVDARADLYSMGVLLWEMCSGQTLYSGTELTKIVAAQLTDTPPPLAPPVGSVPAQLSALVGSLLEGRRDARPREAATVRDELRSLRALVTRPPGPPREGRRDRWLWAGGAGAAGLAMIGLLVALGFGGEDDAQIAAPPPVAATRATPTAAPVDDLSDAQHALVEELATSRWRDRRRDAARELLDTAPPGWARAAADLELARTCASRRDALERIAAAPDARAAPVVQRFRDAPPTGCGRGRRSDCYQCIRDDIARAWDALEPR